MRTITLLALFVTALPAWGQTLHRCVSSGGKVVYQDFPCGAAGRTQPRPPVPSPQHMPARPTNSTLDASLRPLGFDNYASYQRARQTCLALLSNADLTGSSKNCSLGDTRCLDRAVNVMRTRHQQLVNTAAWRQNRCDTVMQIEQGGKNSGSGSSRTSYEIEVSHNDELFVINGEKFEAQTYCFNMEEGDRVIFIDGNALGACASATLVNLRTKQKCAVWCE